MNILITGGAGFVGGHLAMDLLRERHNISVIDDLSTGSFRNIAHMLPSDNFHFANCSVTNEVVLDRMASEADLIIHLAAAVGVELIIREPTKTIETNIMGTEAVLKAAHRYGCKVIIASTSEVYGKGSKVPFCEDDDVILGPTSRCRWSYAATKMVDEFLALAYAKEKGLRVVILRLFNIVGPRQSGRYGMVIPRFMEQALAGRPLTVYGDGTQRRCFCDVTDAIEAIVKLMHCPAAEGQIINVGSEEQIAIKDLAWQVIEATGSTSKIEYIPYAKAYAEGFEDMERRQPSLEKLKSLIDWEPKTNLDQILKRLNCSNQILT